MDIISYILSRKYCDMSIVGLGAIKGANCTVKDIVHQDGINTVTFEWTGTDGTTKTRDMVVYDGTPIYVWESGNTYHYGDLAIYESQFYRCIVENNDVTFDSTKWNEIGSPDGNYDIVQSVNLLPARFTAADRKLYYVIDENCFYLWNGTAWVKTISNKIADLDDVNLDDLAEGDVLVWDSVNEKWVNKAKFDEYKTTFTGTQAQWNALTPAQQNVYEIINITDDGEVINLGVYLEKKATLPTANADNIGKIYIYTGASNANYKKGACYECQHIGQTYTWVQVSVSKDDFDALGTASAKNYTSNVRPNNTDLVESQAVYSAINNALSSIYVPRGELSCAELTTDLLIPANVGNVYTMSDSGTTSALFINGAGHPIAVNDNVGIIRAGADSIMFNLMGNAFDLHDYQTKELETPITIDGTEATEVEGALSGLNGAVDKRVTYEYNGKVGAKNLLAYPYANGDGVYAGMTVATDNDGVITINGTNDTSSTGYYFIKNRTSASTKKFVSWLKNNGASFRLSGGSSDIPLQVDFYNGETFAGSKQSYSNDTSIVVDIPTNADSMHMFIRFDRNVTADNLTIRPMLRLASDTDDTWQPYAKTNYELTQDVNSLSYIKDVPIYQGEASGAIIANNQNNHAQGVESFAEGHNTQARGQYSHAEGLNTLANGAQSHAEGNLSQASGNRSHAQNEGTIAVGLSQTAIGRYNIQQGTGTSRVDTDHALIIGNGTDNDHRSNALAVQWDGTVVFQDNSTMKSAKTVYEVMGKMGAKNLFAYPYDDTNKTLGGITWTDNGDGSVSANGTSTEYSFFDIRRRIDPITPQFIPIANDFICSIGSDSNISTSIRMVVRLQDATQGTIIKEVVVSYTTPQTISFTDEEIEAVKNGSYIIAFRLYVEANKTVDNITLYPMLRLSDDQDNTWQPYAMTNKQLTDKVNEIESETPYVTPEQFGAVGDGVTDDTDAIVRVLAYDNIIGNGVYAISRPIYAQINSHINMSLSLKAIDTMDYVLWLDAKGSAWNQLVNGEFDISIDCNLLASDGLRIDRFRGSNVKVEVKNFTNNALSVHHTSNMACAENYIQLNASNLETATTVSPNAVGLCCGQDDIYSVVCGNVKTAVKLRYGGNKFEILHAWSSTEDWFLNSVMLDIIVDDKNMFDTFISDTIQVLFKMDNSQVTRYPQIITNNSMIYNNTNVTSLPIYVWWLKDTSPFISSNIYGFTVYRNYEYSQISWASGSVPNILVGDTPVVTDVKDSILGNRCSVFNLSGIQLNSFNIDLDYVYNCTSCFHLIDGIYYQIDADNSNSNIIKQSREGFKQNERVCEYRTRPTNIYTWANYPWISIPISEFTQAELQAMW